MQKSENFGAAGYALPTGAASPARREAIRAIVGRLAGHEDELARRIVARFREEIVDYRAGGDALSADAVGLAVENIEALLADLERGEPVANGQAETTRLGAARRVHQGVSLESFLHGCRVWGQVAWEALRAAVHDDRAEELEAALDIAGTVMRHVDIASTAGAHAYLHEAQGFANYGRVLRRDLLEALLGGERDPARIRGRAHAL
ncbi:MAG TPA: hypothetical protein VGL20_01340, partial [Candidatus Dormibacteraeota bacterium]